MTQITETCTACPANCETCNGTTGICLTCAINYYVDVYTGGCVLCSYSGGPLFYQDDTGICDEICGDGIYMDYVCCDDGNLNNGDGCNSECEVEDGFVCERGLQEIYVDLNLQSFYH